MNKASIRQLTAGDLRGKRVLVRVDFNVPLERGQVTDDTRIRATLPTLEYLLNHGACAVLVSHLGRPKGPDPALSLRPVAERLQALLGKPVRFVEATIGPEVAAVLKEVGPGEVVLLENVRFHQEEEANDAAFAQALAEGKELYVNDAFGTAHRAHASTVGVAAYLPAYAGLLMEKELTVLHNLLSAPQRPFVALVGGAKVSSKIGVLQSLIEKVDQLVVGGGMAFTFLKCQGHAVGKSRVEEDFLTSAQALLRTGKLVLPTDIVVGTGVDAVEASGTVSVDAMPDDLMGLDVGPASIKEVARVLETARTILWNGPMGVFENPAFAQGTEEVARLVAQATSRGAVTVVGGGDSVAAIERLGLEDAFTHVSTGGGATLEFLEGLELPGVAALREGR